MACVHRCFQGEREISRTRAGAHERRKGEEAPLRLSCSPARSVKTNFKTSNYQRLRNAGEND